MVAWRMGEFMMEWSLYHEAGTVGLPSPHRVFLIFHSFVFVSGLIFAPNRYG
jgi:hypothetical protein